MALRRIDVVRRVRQQELAERLVVEAQRRVDVLRSGEELAAGVEHVVDRLARQLRDADQLRPREAAAARDDDRPEHRPEDLAPAVPIRCEAAFEERAVDVVELTGQVHHLPAALNAVGEEVIQDVVGIQEVALAPGAHLADQRRPPRLWNPGQPPGILAHVVGVRRRIGDQVQRGRPEQVEHLVVVGAAGQDEANERRKVPDQLQQVRDAAFAADAQRFVQRIDEDDARVAAPMADL